MVEDSNVVYWDPVSQWEWNIPDGRTAIPCHADDNSCNGSDPQKINSICLYECSDDYFLNSNYECVPGAYRDIQSEAYNQLGMPSISRQDVALEPISGVPSFAPSLTLKNNFTVPEVSNHIVTYPVEGGWYLNLPRAELRTRNRFSYPGFFQLGWAKDAVTLFMPWGSEEYGVRHDEKCYEASDGVTSKSCSGILNDDDWIEWTFFPSPGQQVFSYIVVRTKVQASRATSGVVMYNSGNDYWIIKRYGDDGSLIEFERSQLRPRPRNFAVMDYIPIKTYTTRDHQTVYFDYTWEQKNKNITLADYLYWAITSVQITDPMNRAIKIETTNNIAAFDSGGGLMGVPDTKRAYLPLKGNINIYTGITNSSRQILSGTLVHKVNYNEINGNRMQVDVKKNGANYRQDEYDFDDGYFKLTSSNGSEIWWQQTTRTGTENGFTYHYPNGYREIQYIQTEGYETKEKTVIVPHYYTSIPNPHSYRFFDTSSGFQRDVYYLHEKDSQIVGARKVVEKFTNWFQPTEITTCEISSGTTCDSSDTHTQKYGYNVFGSPVYTENIDGKTAIDLYYSYNIGPDEYNQHFQNDSMTASVKQSLRRAGKVLCNANYENLPAYDYQSYFEEYVNNDSSFNIQYYCSNASNRKVTNYSWTMDSSSDPYDLDSVTSPDGIVTSYTYDYEMGTLPSGYNANGKVWGQTVTGRNSVNTQKTCYGYNNDYQLVAQGIGEAESCMYKKGFIFDESDTSVTMIEDYSFYYVPNCGDGSACYQKGLSNRYLHDDLGRKVAEENSAGVGTIYVYDELDRVVFTFFGCSIGSVFPDGDSTDSNVVPYNFAGSSTAGDDGSGDISFSTSSGQFNYGLFANLNVCSYYRKYKYDTMSNLTETRFFEYWGLDSNKNVQKNVYAPKTVIQLVEYDLMGRPTSSCQHKPYTSIDRCIETEQDIYGNITKKVENGVTREVTYNVLNQPVMTKLNGNIIERNTYEDGKVKYINNKYGIAIKTTIDYDAWNRISSTEDPFGNIITKHYNTDTWLPEYSKTTNDTSLTSFQDYDFDDLGRVVETNSALFDPSSTASSITDISSIASEAILTKNYTYDADTGSITHVEDNFGRAVDYDYDYLNRIIMVDKTDADNNLTLRKRTAYDSTGRISKTQTWSKGKTTVTAYGYDFMGRVNETCVSTTVAGANVNCISPGSSCTLTDTKCSHKLYNTGGQVIWKSDNENGEASDINPYHPFQLTVGNEVVYSYNAFGDIEEVSRRMTDDGLGGGTVVDPLFSDGFITTSYEYDSLGRLLTITDDNGATTNYDYTSDNLLHHEMYCMSSGCTNPRTVSYSYDSNRDIYAVTYSQDSESITVNYWRDDYGRVWKKYTGISADDVYQIFTYNERNLLATAQSVNPTDRDEVLSEVSRTYDSLGLIKSETIDGSTVSSSIAWASATKTLTETITLPDSKNIVETNVKGRADNLTYDGDKLLQYDYDLTNGNVLSNIYKNYSPNPKIILSYTYTDWKKTDTRTEKFIIPAPDPDIPIADYEYTYSKGLHLIGKEEKEEVRREAYQYDSYYRLRRVDYDCDYNSSDPTCNDDRDNVFACNPNESNCDDFQLDGVHNIKLSHEDGSEYEWTVDGFNRLTKKTWNNEADIINYTYDSSNNLTGEDLDGDDVVDVVYTYDKLNRLIGFSNDYYDVTYSYDPFNRRTKKLVSYTDSSIDYEVTHKYLYDGWNVVSEEIKTDRITTPAANISWVLRRYVDHGMDNHVIMDTVTCTDDGNGNCSPNEASLERIWFHKDERGNVIAISDGDDTISERYTYSVYGDHKVLDSSFNTKTTEAVSPFLWGGSMYEPETGLYWMRNRYYSKSMHRFINQDPIGIWGDANNLGNGFAYVAGMVVEATDPMGLEVTIKISRASQYTDYGGRFGTLRAVNDRGDVFTATVYETPRNNNSPDWEENTEGTLTYQKSSYSTGKTYSIIRLRIEVDGDDSGRQIHNGQNAGSGHGCFLIGTDVFNYNPEKSTDRIYVAGNTNRVMRDFLDFLNNDNDLNIVIDEDEGDGVEDYGETDPVPATPPIYVGVSVEAGGYGNAVTEVYDNYDGTTTEVYEDGTILIRDSEGNIIACEGDGCEDLGAESSYPSDPNNVSDKLQNFLLQNLLKRMLKRENSNQGPVLMDRSTGPNGSIIFYRNPYYVNKDPMKSLFICGTDGAGRPILIRNPFAPKRWCFVVKYV